MLLFGRCETELEIEVEIEIEIEIAIEVEIEIEMLLFGDLMAPLWPLGHHHHRGRSQLPSIFVEANCLLIASLSPPDRLLIAS
jgi:hypothetical protein